MKYKEKFTPHELAIKTVRDIKNRRRLEAIGKKQAMEHCMSNREKINRRLNGHSYCHKRY